MPNNPTWADTVEDAPTWNDTVSETPKWEDAVPESVIPTSIDVDESGLPTSTTPRQRKRIDLASQLAAEQVRGEALDAEAHDLARQERNITRFANPFTTIVNAPGQIMAELGGVSDTYEPIYKKDSLLHLSVPQEDTSALAGVGRSSAKLINSLSDPDELMKLPAAELGALGKALFAIGISAEAPDQVQHAVQVWRDPRSTKADKAEAITDPAVSAAMLTALGYSKAPASKVPEYPGLPDPDLVARNAASPGTMRPQELERFGAPEAEAPEMFQAGEVPFNRMQRFGGRVLPPVEVLPRMGRIENVPILEELRPKEELETRGKVSFGAEAPTLLRNALEVPEEVRESVAKAQDVGLDKSVEALKQTTKEANRAVQEPKAESIPVSEAPGNSAAVGEGIPAPEAPAPVREAQGAQEVAKPTLDYEPKSTDAARELGYQSQSPEGIKAIEDKLAEKQAEFDALKEQMKAATDPKQKMAIMDKLGQIASGSKHMLTEALKIANGTYLDRPLDVEWVKQRMARDVPTTAVQTEPPTGTVRLYRGQNGEGAGGAFWSKNPDYAASFGKDVQVVDVPESVAAAGEKALREQGNGTKDAVLLPDEWQNKATPMENPPAPKVVDVTEPRTKLVEDTVKSAQAEVESLIKSGEVPESVKSFSDLQDHIDANMLVNSPEIGRVGKQLGWKQQDFIDFTTDAINKLDDWLKNRVPHGTFSEGAKAIADKLRDQFKTPDTGAQLGTFGVVPKVINAAVELAAKVIEKGGTVADAIAEALDYIRKNHGGYFDEKGFTDSVRKTVEPLEAARQKNTETRRAFGVDYQAASTKPAVPATTGKPVSADLKDIYRIFEPEAPKKPTLRQRGNTAVEAIRTGFSSKFRPLNKLAEDISKEYGAPKKDVAGVFEQLKGSSGKAQADIYRFNQDMKPVQGSEKDFNAYVFLRRSLDRLKQDEADAAAGLPVRRGVSSYTIPELEAKLSTLEAQVGDKLPAFEKAADAYQKHMDQALALQVDSGRMSQEVYDAIKKGNQFYAPFKVMKYIEESSKPKGSGARVDTMADYVKAMEGIESPEFKLGDMLGAARQNIAMSRVLAEKNKAMQQITDLAGLDTDGLFVKKLKGKEEPPRGWADVNVLENGEKQRYAVNQQVADAVQVSEKLGGIFPRMAAGIFRFGATTGNIPFQISNILADTPRQALVSKFGIQILPDLLLAPFDKLAGRPTNLKRSAIQSLKYPIGLLDSIYSGMFGEVAGVKNKTMLDFLDSGSAGTSIQEYLTPGALRKTTAPESLAKKVVMAPVRFATAIEQTSKLLGVKRAMELRNLESAKDLTPDEITEIRRFSGSPDFGRMGKWTEKYGLNIAEMFLNARIQGAVADVGRLTGRDGARTAAATWINLAAAVGLPTLLLYLRNHKDAQSTEAIDQRSDQEKKNYWLIPKTDEQGNPRYITTQQGEKIQDYWRVPKRESSKWTANFVEAGLDFARKRDPETFNKWATGMLEEVSPVNISGKNAQERMESAVGGLNPLAKAPIELSMNRDTYRHKPVVPDTLKKASPEQQYTDRTAEVFKQLAQAMPDVAPEFLRSPLTLENMAKNISASLLTQFLPRKPVEGRTGFENTPLMQRFQALPFLDSGDFDERMSKYERESADEQINRFRKAREIIDANKGKPLSDLGQATGGDPKLVSTVVDLWMAEQRGITPQERRIIALPAQERARYIADELQGKSEAEKGVILGNLSRKRILTAAVAQELVKALGQQK